MADMVITVSYAMQDELIQAGFPAEKIRVCYNGVDPKKYNPEQVSQRTNQRNQKQIWTQQR